jgi:hypothetical protein
MKAEQLLRLHSELMVVAVMCRTGSAGQDLSAAYVSFTQKNIGALHNAEQTMIDYYKETSKDDPIENLDRLRTRLGNEAGQTAAKMSAPNFCARYRDKVCEFSVKSPEAIDKQTKKMAVATPSFVKSCGKTVRTKKGG